MHARDVAQVRARARVCARACLTLCIWHANRNNWLLRYRQGPGYYSSYQHTLRLPPPPPPQELVEAKIGAITDFEWVSRQRYYWRDDIFMDMVQVRVCMYGSRSVCVAVFPAAAHCVITLN